MSDEKILPSVSKAIQRSNEIMKAKYGRYYNNAMYKSRKRLIAQWFEAKHRGDIEAMTSIDKKLGIGKKSK